MNTGNTDIAALQTENATLKAEVQRLREVLSRIADMPEYDQDDAHRLRHMAQQALNQKDSK